MSFAEEKKTSTLSLAAAWIVVAIPLGWGVYQTVVKSIPLFRAAAVAESPVPPAAPR